MHLLKVLLNIKEHTQQRRLSSGSSLFAEKIQHFYKNGENINNITSNMMNNSIQFMKVPLGVIDFKRSSAHFVTG